MSPGSSVRTYGEHDQDEEKGVEHGEDRAGEGRGDLVQRPAAPAHYWRSLSVRSLYDRYVLKVSGRLLYTCTDLIGSHSRHRRFGNMRHADMPARAAARTGGLNLWSSLQQPMKHEWHPGRPELAEEAHSTEGPKRADDAHRQDGRARESRDGQGDDKGVDNVVAVAEEGSQPA